MQIWNKLYIKTKTVQKYEKSKIYPDILGDYWTLAWQFFELST